MVDPLTALAISGAAADLAGAGGVIRGCIRKANDKLGRPNPEKKAVRQAFSKALDGALLTATATDATRDELRERIWDLLELVDDTELGSLLITGSEPQLLGVASKADAAQQQIVRQCLRDVAEPLRQIATTPGSTLFNAAALEAMRRTHQDLQALREQVGEIPDVIATMYAAPAVATPLPTETLPQSATAILREIAETEPALASRIATFVEAPDTRVANLRHLTAERPVALLGPNGESWRFIAELSLAHITNDVAHIACGEAAVRDTHPGRRLFWRLRAAQTSTDPVSRLAAIDIEQETAAGQALVTLAQAVQVQDHARVLELADQATGVCEQADLFVANVTAQIHRINLDVDRAVAILEPVATPGRTALCLQLATALIIRAGTDHAQDRVTDAARARELASNALTARRRWGMQPEEAAATLCEAAAASDDWEAVIKYGTSGTGDATPTEAAHPTVKELVGLARTIVGDHDPHELGGTPSTQAWLRGLQLSRTDGANDELETTAAAIDAFKEAVELANGTFELTRSLRGLATQGVHPLPRIDELHDDDPITADTLDAIARYNQTNSDTALADLRLLATESRLAVGFLVLFEQRRGNAEIAAAHAIDGAERFHDPGLTALAVEVLRHANPTEADRIALDGLNDIGLGAPVRRELAMMRVQLASDARDPKRMLATAKAALKEGLTESKLHWAIVQAHLELNDATEAWRHISDNALDPDTEVDAVRFLNAHAFGGPKNSTEALDVMDRFADHEDVIGHALVLRLGIEPGDDGVEDEGIRLRYGTHLDRFQRTFPDSKALWSIKFDPDDPNAAEKMLEAMLPPPVDPDTAETIAELEEHMLNGNAPVGALLAVMRRSTVSFLVSGSVLQFVAIPGHGRLAAELEAARRALSGDVVVDLTTLAALSVVPDGYDHVRRLTSRLSIATTQRTDLELQAVQGVPMGYPVRSPEGPRMFEIPEADRTAIRSRFDWMTARAAELPQEPTPKGDPILGFGDIEDDGTWTHGARVAHAGGRSLLCDDVALAELARAAGINAFSTVALLMAAADAEQIEHTLVREHLNRCFLAQFAEMPVPVQMVTQFADASDWPLPPVLNVIARPTFWGTTDAPAFFTEAVNRILGRDRSDLGSVIAATIHGAGRFVQADLAAGFVSAVLCQLWINAHLSAAEVRVLVDVTRARWRWPGDPVAQVLQLMVQTLSGRHDSEAVAEFIRKMTVELSEEDQGLAARTLLGLNELGEADTDR